jgi:hypothetical protein
MATLLNMFKKQKMELPYDLSLSHHQLLFNVIIVISATNMEILFTKSKQNEGIFIEILIY